MLMKIRVAAVQPRSHHGPDEERNIEQALKWMDEAARQGADLVVFPEGYPGPTNPANRYDAFGPLAERARSLGLHVVAGRIEPVEGEQGHHVCLHLIDDSGVSAGIYRRTSPVGPYVYKDLDIWQVDYVDSPEPPQVVSTRLGRIGMLVCSEVYVPELSRLLARRGPDLDVGNACAGLEHHADAVVGEAHVEGAHVDHAIRHAGLGQGQKPVYQDADIHVGVLHVDAHDARGAVGRGLEVAFGIEALVGVGEALEVTGRPDGVGGADGHVAREPAEHRVDVDVRARVWVARGARETGVRPGDAHATPLVHS